MVAMTSAGDVEPTGVKGVYIHQILLYLNIVIGTILSSYIAENSIDKILSTAEHHKKIAKILQILLLLNLFQNITKITFFCNKYYMNMKYR